MSKGRFRRHDQAFSFGHESEVQERGLGSTCTLGSAG